MALHIRHTNSLNEASSRAFRIKSFFLSDSIEKCCILLHGNEFLSVNVIGQVESFLGHSHI